MSANTVSASACVSLCVGVWVLLFGRTRAVGAAPAGVRVLLAPPRAVPQQTPAHEPVKRPAHHPAGQRVDDGVHGGIQDGQRREPIGFEQNRALFVPAGHVDEQQHEDGRPEDDEDAHHDADGAQERHGVLAVAVLGDFAAAALDQGVNAGVEDGDGQQEQDEDGDAERNVALAVQREDGRALNKIF